MDLLNRTIAQCDDPSLLAQRARYAMLLNSPFFKEYVLPLKDSKDRDCVIAWALGCLRVGRKEEAFTGFVRIVRTFPDCRISDTLELIKLAFSPSVIYTSPLFDIPLHVFLPVMNSIVPKQTITFKRRLFMKLTLALIERFPYAVVFPIQFSLESDVVGGVNPPIADICAQYANDQAFVDARQLLGTLDAIALPLRAFLPGAIKTLQNTITAYNNADETARAQIRGRYALVQTRFSAILQREVCPYDKSLVERVPTIVTTMLNHMQNLLAGSSQDLGNRRDELRDVGNEVGTESSGVVKTAELCSTIQDFSRIPGFGLSKDH
jgi:hypothetical protein